jgi:EmrB/QacA subfamily drug resistance transporter
MASTDTSVPEQRPVRQEPPDAEHGLFSRKQTLIVFAGLLMCMALGALDQTVVATALPTIIGELHGVELATWLFTAYIIAAGIATPMYGKLADLYGRRKLYIFALCTFLVGSALAGAAQNMGELIAFRGIQGLGAGGLMVLTLTIIGDIVPLSQRGAYMGLYGAVLGLSSLAGPLISGFFTDHLSWRWLFYINLPLGLAGLVLILVVLKLPPRRTSKPVDYAGFVLLAGAIVAITLVTSWGGNRYDWSSTVIIALIGAAAVLLTLFVLTERRVEEPLIPLRLFRTPTMVLACVASMLVFTAINVLTTFGPMFMQLVTGISATNTGLLMLPTMLGLIVSSVVGGALINKWHQYKWSPIVGCAIGAAAFGMLAVMGLDTSWIMLSLALVVFGLGLGLAMQPLVIAVQATADRRDLGIATATVAFSQRIGGAIGLSALGAVFSNRFSDAIGEHLGPQAAAQLPPDGSLTPAAIRHLPDALRIGLQETFSDALTVVFLYGVPLLLAGLVLCLFLRNVRLEDGQSFDEFNNV